MALPTGGYSFTPQVANLGASPLSALKPLDVGVSVQFTPMPKYEVPSAQQELVSQGTAKGFQGLVEPVFAALKAKEEKKQADADRVTERAHEVTIANIKAAPTEAERAYQQQRSDLLKEQIDAAKAKNKEDSADDGFNAIPSGIIDWSSYNRKKDFKTPVNEVPSAPATTPNPASSSAPPVVPNAPVAPAGVSKFAPGDAGKTLFQFDQTTSFDESGKVIPAATTDSPKKSNLFSDISAITPDPTIQFKSGYNLAPPKPREVNLPETVGTAKLQGVSLPMVPVSGAEEKPLAGTPPPVESELPTQQPSEPVLAQAVPETEAEYRYRLENDLTGQPFMSPADARMAKNILEQQLGVKAKVNGIDAGKGKKIYRVEIIEDAPSPMESVPKGMVMKQVVDKDGQLTNTYIPKMPVEQQVQYVNVALDRAKTLKTAISEIRGIIGGISPGVGGAANLMAKLPWQTDASTVESLNETIKGIIGFQELVDLKAAGGSLGALSDAELKMLTSLQGSLDVKNLHRDKYLKVLENIEARASDVEKKMEANKKDLMNVEKKTNFQPIQPKSQTYQKGQVAIVNGNSYKWDGNQWNLIQ
jgi:hypothetical protein